MSLNPIIKAIESWEAIKLQYKDKTYPHNKKVFIDVAYTLNSSVGYIDNTAGFPKELDFGGIKLGYNSHKVRFGSGEDLHFGVYPPWQTCPVAEQICLE